MALTNLYIFDIYIIYIILQCILFRTWLLIFTRWYGAVVSAPAWYWELVGSNPAWGVPLTNVYCHIFYFFVTFIFCTFYSNKLYSLWLGLKNIFDIFCITYTNEDTRFSLFRIKNAFSKSLFNVISVTLPILDCKINVLFPVDIFLSLKVVGVFIFQRNTPPFSL